MSPDPNRSRTNCTHGRSKYRLIVLACLISSAVFNAVLVYNARGAIFEGYGDFASFYTAGKIVQRGQRHHLYDSGLQWQVQREFAARVSVRRGPLPYVRPPFEALMFLPLAYVSYPRACALWMALNIVFLFAIPVVLARYLPRDRWALLYLEGPLCMSLAPVALNFMQGQDALLLALLLALAIAALQHRADFRCGMWLALGLFKFHLVLPIVLIFALRGKTKVVLGSIVTGAVLVLVSAMMVGVRGVIAYPGYLWSLGRLSTAGVFAPEVMPNLRGLFAAFHVASGVTADWIVIACMIVGVVLVARLWKPADDTDPTLAPAGYSLAVLVALLTSYYAYSHDLTLLILPLLLLGGFARASKLGAWTAGAIVVFIGLPLFTPLYWIVIVRFRNFYWLSLMLLLLSAGLAYTMIMANTPCPEARPAKQST